MVISQRIQNFEVSGKVPFCHSELVSGSRKSLILLDVPPAAGFSMTFCPVGPLSSNTCNPSISGAVESKWSPLRNLEMRIIREWGIGG
jgi:hypothetical protein